MENLQYIPKIDKRQHIITLKDIFSYYDVKKVKGKGNLRIIYGRKDKRDLVISIFNVYIAEMFDVFVEGGLVYNFPDPKESKMVFLPVSEKVVAEARANGKLKLLDPMATNFKSIRTAIRTKYNLLYYDNDVILSENYQKKIYAKLNRGNSMIGKKDVYWNDFMDTIYNTYTEIDKKSLNDIVLYGLRKIMFFLSKSMEVFMLNGTRSEFIYMGRSANKCKDVAKRNKLLTKQYIHKLRWHWQAKKEYSLNRYYCLNEEAYQKHLSGQTLDSIVVVKLKEECLIGKPWYKYVMKTELKTSRYSTLVKDYDSSKDELIFIKPVK